MDRTIANCSRPEVIDLISVVFEPELVLLEIQARSIEQYIDCDRIANIYVVVNDRDHVVAKVHSDWWGQNAHKVRIIPRNQFGVVDNLDGWSSQQFYKLAAANIAESQWSMCLDTKTWFVQPLRWDQLFEDSGRAHCKSIPCNPTFYSARQFVQKFFNISFTKVVWPGGVPFMFHTNTVNHMITDCERLANKSFIDFFSKHVLLPDELTEFVLYSGYIEYIDKFSSLYSNEQQYKVTNIADWELTNFSQLLTKMQSSNNLTASIQGRAYPHLSDQQLDQWVHFLLSKQLITDTKKTKILLNTLR